MINFVTAVFPDFSRLSKKLNAKRFTPLRIIYLRPVYLASLKPGASDADLKK